MLSVIMRFFIVLALIKLLFCPIPVLAQDREGVEFTMTPWRNLMLRTKYIRQAAYFFEPIVIDLSENEDISLRNKDLIVSCIRNKTDCTSYKTSNGRDEVAPSKQLITLIEKKCGLENNSYFQEDYVPLIDSPNPKNHPKLLQDINNHTFNKQFAGDEMHEIRVPFCHEPTTFSIVFGVTDTEEARKLDGMENFSRWGEYIRVHTPNLGGRRVEKTFKANRYIGHLDRAVLSHKLIVEIMNDRELLSNCNYNSSWKYLKEKIKLGTCPTYRPQKVQMPIAPFFSRYNNAHFDENNRKLSAELGYDKDSLILDKSFCGSKGNIYSFSSRTNSEVSQLMRSYRLNSNFGLSVSRANLIVIEPNLSKEVSALFPRAKTVEILPINTEATDDTHDLSVLMQLTDGLDNHKYVTDQIDIYPIAFKPNSEVQLFNEIASNLEINFPGYSTVNLSRAVPSDNAFSNFNVDDQRLYVLASGNAGEKTPPVISISDKNRNNILVVGGLNHNWSDRAQLSNNHNFLEIYAPSCGSIKLSRDIESAALNITSDGGTSVAAPYVSLVASMIDRLSSNQVSNKDVKNRILRTALTLYSETDKKDINLLNMPQAISMNMDSIRIKNHSGLEFGIATFGLGNTQSGSFVAIENPENVVIKCASGNLTLSQVLFWDINKSIVRSKNSNDTFKKCEADITGDRLKIELKTSFDDPSNNISINGPAKIFDVNDDVLVYVAKQ